MHRTASIVAAGAAAGALLLAGLSQEWLHRRCVEAGLPLSAAVAIVALVVAGAGFLVARTGNGGSLPSRLKMARCQGCGQSLMESWRMCPYCGRIVDKTGDATRAEEKA